MEVLDYKELNKEFTKKDRRIQYLERGQDEDSKESYDPDWWDEYCLTRGESN